MSAPTEEKTTFYRRKLPHWDPGNASIFVTWRLHGTMPFGKFSSGAAFVDWDRRMEQEREGRLLADAAAADLVVETLGEGRDRGKFRLDAFFVMPNHVHVLFFPMADFVTVMKSVKGASARRVDQALGLTGDRLWQDESFDHWVRDATEWQKIVRYIERNPVRAGLAPEPAAYRWSSASEWGRTFLSGAGDDG